MSLLKKIWAAWGHFDALLSLWERLPAPVRWLLKRTWGLILAAISGFIIPWVLGLEARLIAGVIIAIIIGIPISGAIIWKELRRQAPSKGNLNILVKGKIQSGSRILNTPPHILQGSTPAWNLLSKGYESGWMWVGDFTFVNRSQEPMSLSCQLAIPTSEDQANWFKLNPLRNPLYEWRDDMRREMSQIPEHLPFPLDVAPGKHAEGRILFAIDGSLFQTLQDHGDLKALIMAQKKYLHVEDLISNRRIRVSV